MLSNGLFMQALRVQHSKKKFLNAAYDCVVNSRDPVVVKAHEQASAAISKGVMQTPLPRGSEIEGESGNTTGSGFVLITQFYFAEDLATKQNMQDVLVRNLENNAIDEVYLVCDEEYDFSQLPNNHKITKFLLKSRLKFSDALRLANDRLEGRSVILSNSDIYFDQSLEEFVGNKNLPLPSDLLLALSTWEPSGRSLSLSLRSDSQDAWMLTAPVSDDIIQQANFYFGVPRCDNRIAKVFMSSGYKVKNPAFLVHAVEVDSQQRENKVYSKVGEVHGEVANVPLSDSSWL
jgi:hypothetical protein